MHEKTVLGRGAHWRGLVFPNCATTRSEPKGLQDCLDDSGVFLLPMFGVPVTRVSVNRVEISFCLVHRFSVRERRSVGAKVFARD